MAITQDTLPLLCDAAAAIGRSLRGCTIAQLGNQHLQLNASVQADYSNASIYVRVRGLVGTAAELLQVLGASVTSFDMNGLDGSIVADLAKPLGDYGQFDLVTNYGTSEHVNQAGELREQYECFASIHRLGNPRCAFVHVIPHTRDSLGHQGLSIWTYAPGFFSGLAKLNGYTLTTEFECPDCKGHTAAILTRESYSPFCSFEDFCTLPIVGDIAEHGQWVGDMRALHMHDAGLSAALCEMLQGKSVVDLGCGAGNYVRALREAGIEAEGYDGNPATPELTGGLCGVFDMANGQAAGNWDTGLCLEVLEHIPAECESTAIDHLTTSCRNLIISWAPASQPGHGHVNPRPLDYVASRFEGMGFQIDEEETIALRSRATLPWFRNNLLVFTRA